MPPSESRALPPRSRTRKGTIGSFLLSFLFPAGIRHYYARLQERLGSGRASGEAILTLQVHKSPRTRQLFACPRTRLAHAQPITVRDHTHTPELLALHRTESPEGRDTSQIAAFHLSPFERYQL